MTSLSHTYYAVNYNAASLQTNKRQLGFKKHLSTLDAIHNVRKIPNYFCTGCSTVNLGVHDLKKAFDKTNIYGILLSLYQKKY